MPHALAESSEALTDAREREEGVVRVAAITGAVGGLLVHALPEFARAHGAVTIHVRESDPAQWGLQLARGEVDLALVRQPELPPAGFVFQPLQQDCFVVVCAQAHRMAQRRRLDRPSLAACTWLRQAVGSVAREVLDHQLALVPLSVVQPWVDVGRLHVVDLQPTLRFKPLGLLKPVARAMRATQTFIDFIEAFAAQREAVTPPPARQLRTAAACATAAARA